MIETRDALRNLDAILATPGIDAVFLGPSDLSLALTDGKTLDPAFAARSMPRSTRSARRRRRPARSPAPIRPTPQRANELAARGFRFLAVASDTAFLRAGTDAAWKALKR